MSPEDTQHLYMLDTHSPEELERFRLENRVRELEKALEPMKFASIEIPIRTENPMNGGWGGWKAQAGKRKNERARVGKYLLTVKLPKAFRVTITRVGVNEMDHAGLLASLKSVQDAIANRMGVDDKPSGVVEWVFRQEKGKRGEPVVRVEFEVLT